MDGAVGNGGCMGPDATYVKLISSDGFEFIVKKSLALKYSPTIKAMMRGPGEVAEDEVNEVSLSLIPSHILALVCNFYAYKERYSVSNQKADAPDVPDFVIRREVTMDLLMASDFLDC